MKRQHNGSHLDFVRSFACCVCGDDTTTEAAHIRFGEPRAGKRPTGLGEKPHDAWTVPLCGDCHRAQHMMGERQWWKAQKIDPLFVSLALYRASGDREAGEQIINSAHSTG
jgi:hypothetical protein